MSVFDVDEVVGFEGSISYDSSKLDGTSLKTVQRLAHRGNREMSKKVPYQSILKICSSHVISFSPVARCHQEGREALSVRLDYAEAAWPYT